MDRRGFIGSLSIFVSGCLFGGETKENPQNSSENTQQQNQDNTTLQNNENSNNNNQKEGFTGWSQFRHDIKNTGSTSEYTGPKNGVKLEWTRGMGSPIKAPPIIYKDYIYLGVKNGRIYSINKDTKKKKWVVKTNWSIEFTPVVTENTVYLGSGDGNTYALDRGKGEKNWIVETVNKRRTGHNITTSPKYDGSMIYIGNNQSQIFLINTDKQETEYFIKLKSPVEFAPAVEKNKLYVTDWSTVYSININTGLKNWRLNTQEHINSSPCLGQNLYITTESGILYAISNGDIEWKFKQKNLNSNPTIGVDRIYIVDGDGRLYSIDPQNGRAIWVFNSNSNIKGSPVVTKDCIYIVSEKGVIYAISKEGKKEWTYSIDAEVDSEPAVTPNAIYIGSINEQLVKLSAK